MTQPDSASSPSSQLPALDGEAALRWVELADRLRACETLVLRARGLLRGVDEHVPATASVVLHADDVGDALELCEAVAEAGEQARMLAERLPVAAFALRLRDLQPQAAAALAAGVLDPGRATLLASCLPPPLGFPALAAALRCTDCHDAWAETTLADVLGAFRDVGPPAVQRLAAEALLSPDARWDACDRDQIARLAAVLERDARPA